MEVAFRKECERLESDRKTEIKMHVIRWLLDNVCAESAKAYMDGDTLIESVLPLMEEETFKQSPFHRFVRLTDADVHPTACAGPGSENSAERVLFSSVEGRQAPSGITSAIQMLREVFPEAVIVPKLHTAWCCRCGTHKEKYGVVVRIKQGPLTFRREFEISAS
jgi:hypothetical protein